MKNSSFVISSVYIWEEFPLPEGLRAIVLLPLSPGTGSHTPSFETSFYYHSLESTLEIIRDCCLLEQRYGKVKFRPFFRLIFVLGSHLEPLTTSEIDTAYLGQGKHVRE